MRILIAFVVTTLFLGVGRYFYENEGRSFGFVVVETAIGLAIIGCAGGAIAGLAGLWLWAVFG